MELDMSAANRTTVFISYSHRDSEWLRRLQVHLSPLEREYGIEVWDDTRIEAGSYWQESISRALTSARVAVILVSADFLASRFIALNELPPLLAAAESDGVIIIPLLVSASRFLRTASLAKFQAVNDPARPLVDLSRGEQERVLDELSRRIELLLPKPLGLMEGPALGSHTPLPLLQMEEAAKGILQHARQSEVEIGTIERSPTTVFGSASYRARTTDGKGVIYCHIDGSYQGQSFYVRKGIGWFYEILLGGAESRLGLPVSNEEIADGTKYPTSQFEGGYIEWSPITKVARAVLRTSRGDQTLAEKRL
jgi:hypothetical protein